MLLNRRAFLDFCGKTFATFAAASNAAVMAADDLYVNRKLGVAFRPPGGWHIVNASAMGEVPANNLFAIEEGILCPGDVDWLSQPFLTLRSSGRNGDTLAHFYVAELEPAFNELNQLLDLFSELPEFTEPSGESTKDASEVGIDITTVSQAPDSASTELDDELKSLAAFTGILATLPSDSSVRSASGKAFEVKRCAHEFVKDENSKSLATISSSIMNGNRMVIVQMQSQTNASLPLDTEFIEFLDKIRFLREH